MMGRDLDIPATMYPPPNTISRLSVMTGTAPLWTILSMMESEALFHYHPAALLYPVFKKTGVKILKSNNYPVISLSLHQL